MNRKNSLFGLHPRQGWLAHVLWLCALCLLAVGVFAPMLTVKKGGFFGWWMSSNTVSLASGLGDLWVDSYYFLFSVILGFSILFPVVKIIILMLLWHSDMMDSARHRRRIHFMNVFGKWSMMDVFAVAVLLVSVKLGAMATVEIHYGLYAFCCSVILTMLLTVWTATLSEKNLNKISVQG